MSQELRRRWQLCHPTLGEGRESPNLWHTKSLQAQQSLQYTAKLNLQSISKASWAAVTCDCRTCTWTVVTDLYVTITAIVALMSCGYPSFSLFLYMATFSMHWELIKRRQVNHNRFKSTVSEISRISADCVWLVHVEVTTHWLNSVHSVNCVVALLLSAVLSFFMD